MTKIITSLALVLAFALSGCAASTHWVGPEGTSTLQSKKDLFECKVLASGSSGIGSARAMGNIIAISRARQDYREMYRECLESKGYAQVEDGEQAVALAQAAQNQQAADRK